MAITKRLIDLLEGTITVKSQSGVGTMFDVLLPMDVMVDPVEEQEDFWGLHVLLIDDDPMQQKHTGNLLRSMGMKVECTDFAEAGKCPMTHWQAEDYGFIILSLGLAGTELMEKAGAICRRLQGRAPLIVSAYDISGVKEKATEWGMCGFMDQPLWPSRVIGCLSRLDEKVKPPEKKTGWRETEPFDFAGSRVLLVEDNELNREIALELLRGFGLELEVAVNGREALKCFEESRTGYYSLILMDIQMPVMNGYEAARAIRSLSREDAKTVPILAMTADAFVEDIENTKTAGMNGHLSKPLDFKLLMREMQQFLRG